MVVERVIVAVCRVAEVANRLAVVASRFAKVASRLAEVVSSFAVVANSVAVVVPGELEMVLSSGVIGAMVLAIEVAVTPLDEALDELSLRGGGCSSTTWR